MDEYIERDGVLMAVMQHGINVGAMEVIRDYPAADVVQVVRCKDCKWCRAEAAEYMGYTPLVCVNANPASEPVPTWKNCFCSKGEKEDTND